jgi:ribosomal protein S18 acetylase RimI-like enzyme
VITIQRLSPADAVRFRTIRLASLQDAPDAFGSTYADAAKRTLEGWAEQLTTLPTFVAVLAGEDVGVARGGVDHDRKDSAYLLSMWVAPKARGKGAGDALVDAVVGWAKASGFTRVVLDVADHNRPAIALYARKGFVPTGETGALPPPREHVLEHRRALTLR